MGGRNSQRCHQHVPFGWGKELVPRETHQQLWVMSIPGPMPIADLVAPLAFLGQVEPRVFAVPPHLQLLCPLPAAAQTWRLPLGFSAQVEAVPLTCGLSLLISHHLMALPQRHSLSEAPASTSWNFPSCALFDSL